MHDALSGVRVLEVAQFWFVPAAGAILRDWGAEVIKIEHPVHGDAQRGLAAAGLGVREGGVDFMMQQSNRGKRSVGLDLSKPEGRELLMRLASRCDVFLTNFLPDARARLGIEVSDLRAANPEIIYVRGSGQGPRGPERNRGGYDATSFWFRGGVADGLTPPDAETPTMPRAAFGDSIAALGLAAGISAALFRRERSGETCVVDVSLLGTALWTMAPDVVASPLLEPGKRLFTAKRRSAPNPIGNTYRTKDGRWLMLMALQPDRYWADVCQHLERPEWIDDERFRDAKLRFVNRKLLINELDLVFAERTLEEWRARLATLEAPWEPMQQAPELHDDPQVQANGYLTSVPGTGPEKFRLVANPVQFDEQSPALEPSPEMGQHTEEVLLEAGLDWEDLARYREAGVLP